jgi:uncharacterized protein GlcG (DUF336 family)
LSFFIGLLTSCSQTQSGRQEGLSSADFDCSGTCTRQSLSTQEVTSILENTIRAAAQLSASATIAIVDRVGNVLALYQMTGASTNVTIDGQISAQGGLEAQSVPSTLAAISKAGTGAFLSSQGQAFSTRTASQIIQEHFSPGENSTPGGPLFGVQFSQLPCSDINVRLASFTDGRASLSKPSFGGLIGPRALPLGLSADPGGIPLYEKGDVVGGLGVEINGTYTLDRNVFDVDDQMEERVALMGSAGFEAPSKRVASNINVGKSLRYTDLRYSDLAAISRTDTHDPALLVALPEYFDGNIKAGSEFGTSASGIFATTRAGGDAQILVDNVSANRFPNQNGAALSGAELTSSEVDALLDSAIVVARRARAAIRRPLSSSAQVTIWIVDHLGNPLGFTRTSDAPVFGIDVALQKARTATLFSAADAGDFLTTQGHAISVSQTRALLGDLALTSQMAMSARAVGNLAKPFLPDGIADQSRGPLSLPFPASTSIGDSWSPFNTGLQFDLIEASLLNALPGGASANFPDHCGSTRYGNGIQIFPGGVPLYRGNTLIGGIGVSGDGIDQDDLIAFYGASRLGLDEAGHSAVGDSSLGFLPARSLRIDQQRVQDRRIRLRFVSCPESPFRGESKQNVCANL